MVKIKTEKEIEILREGGRKLAGILNELSSAAQPGVSLRELDNLARKLAKENGGQPTFLDYTPRGAKRPYPAAICTSLNEEVVHGIPNERDDTLEEGDVLGIDMGLTYGGLITDSTVTVGVGEIDEEARRLIDVTKKCLEEAIKVIKPDACVGDIGYIVEKTASESGFGVVESLGGHGVGHALHEDPFVPNVGNRGEGEKLRPGMVLAVEPILTEGSSAVKMLDDGYTYITKDGGRSAEFEHTIVVTDNGAEVLTQI